MCDNNNICGNCQKFISYQAIYEDDLEPDDCGKCLRDDHHVDYQDSCEFHKIKDEPEN